MNYSRMSTENLAKLVNERGGIAFIHPRQKRISINGGPRKPYSEARARMIELLILHDQRAPEREAMRQNAIAHQGA